MQVACQEEILFFGLRLLRSLPETPLCAGSKPTRQKAQTKLKPLKHFAVRKDRERRPQHVWCRDTCRGCSDCRCSCSVDLRFRPRRHRRRRAIVRVCSQITICRHRSMKAKCLLVIRNRHKCYIVASAASSVESLIIGDEAHASRRERQSGSHTTGFALLFLFGYKLAG